jgi:hypothetical protein
MNVTVAQLEKQHANYKELIERRRVAERLAQNPDFKDLILDHFCVEECARYARESANPALNAESRADALALAQAAGHLKRFLSVIVQMGASAEKEMVDLEEALVEARAEEGAA